MAIFKKKKKAAKIPVEAPEEPETEEEVGYTEQMDKSTVPPLPEVPQEEFRVPVCLSQSQINSLVIENNIMLKQLMKEIEE